VIVVIIIVRRWFIIAVADGDDLLCAAQTMPRVSPRSSFGLGV
jgi:hypothetical protein